MICNYCKKDNSDDSKFCTECGKELFYNQTKEVQIDVINNEDTIPVIRDNNKFNRIIQKAKTYIKTHKLISSLILIFLLFLSIGLSIIISNTLSSDEKNAYKICEELKGMLKDPDSLVLYEDVLEISIIFDEEVYTFYYIDYGAKNGYGAINRSTALFNGYSYLGDMGNITASDENYHTSLIASWVFSIYNLYGDDFVQEDLVHVIHFSISDKDKLMRKLY